ncbi:hypothetical protein M8J76_011513 [Diaphorina citri]|nr:hypothetical protein M8J75_006565 [Diaphorina citri]KAI5733405.1 hypothetical protein M8J76_011513 [Diaphorina citri]
MDSQSAEASQSPNGFSKSKGILNIQIWIPKVQRHPKVQMDSQSPKASSISKYGFPKCRGIPKSKMYSQNPKASQSPKCIPKIQRHPKVRMNSQSPKASP